MSILCGTDFSERSRQAADVAAHLAARTNAPLHLAHAYDARSERAPGEANGDALARIEGELRQEAERLSSTGADVRIHLRAGPPDEVLLDLASELGARLV